MNDVIHEIISMSNDETIYDQYKNSEIKDNNETNDIQTDKKQDDSLSAKNKSDDSQVTNENGMSNIIVNTEIDNNKDSDDKPIDVAGINANKEKLKSVNKRLLNKQMYDNKILDAISPISYNINNKLGQEVMIYNEYSDISPVDTQSVNNHNKSFKFITKTNVMVTVSIVFCIIVFIFTIIFINKRNKTTKFNIISNTNDDNEHENERDIQTLPDYDKDYKQFGTKINNSINGGKNISKHFKTLPKRDNKGRFIKS